ncbi:bifunctional riboflavin kinase/FMN phosphatase-like [Rhododendron vialii]|uniref:bifunctional riboflavin kinase/FMN phosphatase-like n=1 Tax=Rhododendron vialii TaxID=182163 RepID=UPI00265E6FD7|nr:bifunctional riboflavin kinase/FMN phosphatase-like [Rhododendron vialii]
MPPSFSHIHKTKLGFPMNNFNCKTQNSEAPIAAVILDLDGTLLNTEQATKGILGEFLARYGKVLDREKEDKRLGMMHNESAISIVKDYDLPITPDCYTQEIMPLYQEKWVHAKALPGANRLIQHLHNRGVPFALASNSKRKNIDAKISHQQGWREHFAVILGSDQVNAGKPSPDLFLEAAKQMGVDPIHCLVIEDSLVGVKAAKAAGMKVVAVPSLQNAADQYSNADSVLHSLLELQPELWGLPPFDDWVDKALLIDEPFYLKGWNSKGLLCLSEDSEESALPDQLFGLFFGWAKFDAHEVFKVVARIGWDYGCCTCKRKFLIHLLDISNEHISEQEVQILLVGYIQGLSKEEKKAIDTEIPEQDKSVARVSLDLPEFTHHTSMLLFPEACLADDYAASDEKEYTFSD